MWRSPERARRSVQQQGQALARQEARAVNGSDRSTRYKFTDVDGRRRVYAAEVALVASLVLAGLWSGLLLFLTTILHPVFAGLSGPDFAALMRRFLPVARRSATN